MSDQVNDQDFWITWEGEDAVLNFSTKLMEEMGWEEGQELEMEVVEDDKLVIRPVRQD